MLELVADFLPLLLNSASAIASSLSAINLFLFIILFNLLYCMYCIRRFKMRSFISSHVIGRFTIVGKKTNPARTYIQAPRLISAQLKLLSKFHGESSTSADGPKSGGQGTSQVCFKIFRHRCIRYPQISHDETTGISWRHYDATSPSLLFAEVQEACPTAAGGSARGHSLWILSQKEASF